MRDHQVRVLAPGGGRKKSEVSEVSEVIDPELLDALDTLIEMGHPISHSVVANILHSLQYSLQGTRKTLEGRQHPDRDDWFRYINALAQELLASGDQFWVT